jgi:dolichyl-phosphate-mannose--protein O-mannosyl transferase
MIHWPDAPVFDESHFGHFTNRYIQGTYFFDIHPPLAKLIIFGIAVLNQYPGDLNFSDPSRYRSLDYIGLRQIPALFASFCAPVLFVGAKCFGLTTLASFTIALMVVCDNSMIVEARFILTDGILHFFVCLAICATCSVRTQKPYSGGWWFALIFNGIAAGCAVSSKLTSLSILPFIAVVHITQALSIYGWGLAIRDRWFYVHLITEGCVICLCAILVFFASFTAHLIVLPYHGDGADMVAGQFRQTLIKKNRPNQNWRVRTQGQSLIRNILSLNYYMHIHNMRISGAHPYGSRWFTWPFLTGKWVLFWTEGGSHVMCQGQVVNVYCGTLSVIVCALLPAVFFWTSREFREDWARISAFPLAYCASLFPFALMQRQIFFYHYIIPNIFGMLTWVAGVDVLMKKAEYIKGMALAYSQIGTALAFFFWSVWTYGIKMEDFDIRLWNKRWQ